MRQKILLLIYTAFSVWVFYPKFFPAAEEEKVICIDSPMPKIDVWQIYADKLGVSVYDLKQKAFRESRLNPKAVKSYKGKWMATGLFQFTGTTRKELGYNMPMCKYSVEDQLKAHDRYCRKWSWQPDLFKDNERGFRLYMIGFMPKYYKKPMDYVLIRGGKAYKANKNIDTKFGNGDGNISVMEVYNFYVASSYI